MKNSAEKKALVITSIAADNHPVLNQYARECAERDIPFYVVGDTKSPDSFSLDGCRFLSIADQEQLGFKLAEILPKKHYARKNLGYLQALKDGADSILETDDDNLPREDFFKNRAFEIEAPSIRDAGWVNVYSYFTEERIWPRGLPLPSLNKPNPAADTLPTEKLITPIHQGLADENPDVDAIFRLIFPLPLNFDPGKEILLAGGSLSPFNSQNTFWFPEAFPMLYLPSYCSFRMTDIWRSYVAVRICRENDRGILFESPTVWQERNEHDLMRDFEDETEGYLHNHHIGERLNALNLKKGLAHIPENILLCYEEMIRMNLVGKDEIPLLEAWFEDLASVGGV